MEQERSILRLEICEKCYEHYQIDPHCESEYEHCYKQIREICEEIGLKLLSNVPFKYLQRIDNTKQSTKRYMDTHENKIVEYPRRGAFELYYVNVLVFSKIMSFRFPDLDFLRAILVHVKMMDETDARLDALSRFRDLQLEWRDSKSKECLYDYLENICGGNEQYECIAEGLKRISINRNHVESSKTREIIPYCFYRTKEKQVKIEDIYCSGSSGLKRVRKCRKIRFQPQSALNGTESKVSNPINYIKGNNERLNTAQKLVKIVLPKQRTSSLIGLSIAKRSFQTERYRVKNHNPKPTSANKNFLEKEDMIEGKIDTNSQMNRKSGNKSSQKTNKIKVRPMTSKNPANSKLQEKQVDLEINGPQQHTQIQSESSAENANQFVETKAGNRKAFTGTDNHTYINRNHQADESKTKRNANEAHQSLTYRNTSRGYRTYELSANQKTNRAHLSSAGHRTSGKTNWWKKAFEPSALEKARKGNRAHLSSANGKGNRELREGSASRKADQEYRQCGPFTNSQAHRESRQCEPFTNSKAHREQRESRVHMSSVKNKPDRTYDSSGNMKAGMQDKEYKPLIRQKKSKINRQSKRYLLSANEKANREERAFDQLENDTDRESSTERTERGQQLFTNKNPSKKSKAQGQSVNRKVCQSNRRASRESPKYQPSAYSKVYRRNRGISSSTNGKVNRRSKVHYSAANEGTQKESKAKISNELLANVKNQTNKTNMSVLTNGKTPQAQENRINCASRKSSSSSSEKQIVKKTISQQKCEARKEQVFFEQLQGNLEMKDRQCIQSASKPMELTLQAKWEAEKNNFKKSRATILRRITGYLKIDIDQVLVQPNHQIVSFQIDCDEIPRKFRLLSLREMFPPAQISVFPQVVQEIPSYQSKLASLINLLTRFYPLLVRRLFENPTNVNPYGVYCVWLKNQEGVYSPVCVNDEFAFDQHNNPIYGPLANGQTIWFMVLEKAVAKTLGSYSQINQTSLSALMTMIMGCPIVNFHNLKLEKVPKAFQQKHFYNKMSSFYAIESESYCRYKTTQVQIDRIIGFEVDKQSLRNSRVQIESKSNRKELPLHNFLKQYNETVLCFYSPSYSFNQLRFKYLSQTDVLVSQLTTKSLNNNCFWMLSRMPVESLTKVIIYREISDANVEEEFRYEYIGEIEKAGNFFFETQLKTGSYICVIHNSFCTVRPHLMVYSESTTHISQAKNHQAYYEKVQRILNNEEQNSKQQLNAQNTILAQSRSNSILQNSKPKTPKIVINQLKRQFLDEQCNSSNEDKQNSKSAIQSMN